MDAGVLAAIINGAALIVVAVLTLVGNRRTARIAKDVATVVHQTNSINEQTQRLSFIAGEVSGRKAERDEAGP